jgi:hypothetical protein
MDTHKNAPLTPKGREAMVGSECQFHSTGFYRWDEERSMMKITCAGLATALSLLFAAPEARAEVVYPRAPCRIYVDTDFIGLPNQCGSALRVYSRSTLLPHLRR